MTRLVPGGLAKPWLHWVLRGALHHVGLLAIVAPWSGRPEGSRCTLRAFGRKRAWIEWLDGKREHVPLRLLDSAPWGAEIVVPPPSWHAPGGAA